MHTTETRPIIRTTTQTLTYLSARAEVTTIHHDSKRNGLRTIITKWIDDATRENGSHPAGTVTRKTVQGDGRTNDFVIVTAEITQ